MCNVIHVCRLTDAAFVIENADSLRHAPPQFLIEWAFYPTSDRHPRVIIFIADLLSRTSWQEGHLPLLFPCVPSGARDGWLKVGGSVIRIICLH
jgi:hypothetical protein